MLKSEAQKRIKQLKKAINYYRYAYHVLNKSLISDNALDLLKKELFDLEQKYPELITLDSPSQRIGGQPLKEFKKVRHKQPMLSFNDAFSEQDMRNWLKRLKNFLGQSNSTEFYCELKLDGVAVELIYENGIFIQGSTRGNGLIGEDITQNLKTIETIPLNLEIENWKLEIPARVVVYGEVFISKKEFKKLNQEQERKGEKTFANPRNFTAGSLRQLDPKITAQRKLDAYIYDIIAQDIQTHEQKHHLLKTLGFKTNPYNKLQNGLDQVFKFRNYWQKKENRAQLDYEIDGIVVFINDNKIFEKAGVVGKAPRGAIAFKFLAKQAQTTVLDIKVQIGRTGVLTPVAVLRPVKLGGVIVSRATLHNFDEIKRLELKINDPVIVSRAGDVIPEVSEVIKKMRTGREKNFVPPLKCPVCKTKIIKKGVYLKCLNKNCYAVQKRFLRHFVSKQGFNIKGLGEKILNRFLEQGLISDPASIFELKQEDIACLAGFGEKSAQNLTKQIMSSKTIDLAKFIFALGIPQVGEETSLLLASKFFLKNFSFENLSLQELQKIKDIGPETSQSIYDWLHSQKNIKLLERLKKMGITVIEQPLVIKSQKLQGISFVLTGELKTMARGQAKQKIMELGGKVSESISKKTDFLVAGENPGSKLKKAKELGIKIIREKEFLNFMIQ